jgi:hypothetical protein
MVLEKRIDRLADRMDRLEARMEPVAAPLPQRRHPHPLVGLSEDCSPYKLRRPAR